MKKVKILLDMSVTEETAGILFALDRFKEAQVLGISLCFGRTSLESSQRSLGGLMELLGWKAETALGERRPWRRDYTVAMSDEDIGQAINGLRIDTEKERTVPGEESADFLYRKLKGAGELVKIICAGCLTNLAVLLERHPEAAGLIKEIIWCGGTWRHAQLQIVKDYAAYMDPEATQFVLEQGIPFTMCPVDIGERCYITREEIDTRMYEREPVLHEFNRLLKKRWCDKNSSFPIGKRCMHLPLPEIAAVAAAVCPQMCMKEMRYGEVDLKGRLTFGMLVIDINNRLNHREEDMNISQVVGVDRERIVKEFYLGL